MIIFIKKNLKVLVAVIITAILFGGIGVYAATTYLARDIKFNPTNDNFKATNVEDALNELYSLSDKRVFEFTEDFLLSGSFKGNAKITHDNPDSKIGLILTGNSVAIPSKGYFPDNKWEKTIDLTNYNVIVFNAKKLSDHGGIYIAIDNVIQKSVYYSTIFSDWHEYYLDISQYKGEHLLSIGGGYIDNSGSTSSSTSYYGFKMY